MSTRQARRRQQRAGQSRSGGRSAGGRPSSRSRSTTPWWLGPWGLGAAAVVVAAVVVIVIVVGGGGKSPSNKGFHSTTASAGLINTVENPGGNVTSKVGDGGITNPWTKAPTSNPVWKAGGKPVYFFYGAEFCPHCAVERWSLINAMSRFGTFAPGSIKTMLSSATDTNPNTHTFTFLHARYSSPYVDFQAIEAQDRNHATLQNPTSPQATALSKFSVNGFPFSDMANQYTASEPANFDESSFFNGANPLSWKQIARDLKNPSLSITKSVIGTANWTAAAVCKMDGNKPAKACSAAPIPALEKKIG